MKKDNYKKVSLEIVKQSDILKKEDFESLAELKDELKDVFIHSQGFRTPTEMEVSILNDLKFPTADAKYWQSVREQNVMFTELVRLSYRYRKNLVEIKILERDIKFYKKDKLQKELMQIEIDDKTFRARQQEKIAKDRINEIKEWHRIKANLMKDMKYSLVDVNEHQLISYTHRWIRQLEAMGDSGSPSERSNLFGQLDKGLKVCQEKGLIKKLKVTKEQKLLLTNFTVEA